MTYLWGKVEPQIAVVRQSVLDEQGHLARQAELDSFGQAACLAEVGKVLQGESQGHGLGEVDLDVFAGLVHTAVLPELDRARANVTLTRELDAVLCALNSN